MQISLHVLYKYNNQLIISWIGDNNALFWVFSIITCVKYLHKNIGKTEYFAYNAIGKILYSALKSIGKNPITGWLNKV